MSGYVFLPLPPNPRSSAFICGFQAGAFSVVVLAGWITGRNVGSLRFARFSADWCVRESRCAVLASPANRTLVRPRRRSYLPRRSGIAGNRGAKRCIAQARGVTVSPSRAAGRLRSLCDPVPGRSHSPHHYA